MARLRFGCGWGVRFRVPESPQGGSLTLTLTLTLLGCLGAFGEGAEHPEHRGNPSPRGEETEAGRIGVWNVPRDGPFVASPGWGWGWGVAWLVPRHL